MAGYTLVNLKSDVEDMAPKFGYAPNMEAHFARVPLGLQSSGLSYFKVAPGFRVPFGHRHGEQEEIYVVVSGSARVKVDDDAVDLQPFDAIRIQAGATHGFEAGADGAEIIAFGAPNTENRDIEMDSEWWTG
jgi:mannose-6-phosphate isomerase-like protein (cupin superfamily)